MHICISKLLKTSDIAGLMENEQNLHKDIKELDSEMQTLVYENYNKFINATETIREMSSNFDQMESELEQLSLNMEQITTSSNEISQNLKTKRQDLTKLANTYTVLQKLQFLFDLAPKMQSSISHKDYGEAVQFYLSAELALDRYKHFPSIQTIYEETSVILVALRKHLHEQLFASNSSPQQVAESIEYLLKLKESPQQLALDYLKCSESGLQDAFRELEYHTQHLIKSFQIANETDDEDMIPVDILEFVDLSCNGFLANLTLVIGSFRDIFMNKMSHQFNDEEDAAIEQHLCAFINRLMKAFFKKLCNRYAIEKITLGENNLFIRSLDRLYRRIGHFERLYSLTLHLPDAVGIIENACDLLFIQLFELIKEKYVAELVNGRGTMAEATETSSIQLSRILLQLESHLTDQIKLVTESLTGFINPKLSFYSRIGFKDKLCVKIREEIFVAAIKYVVHSSLDYTQKADAATPNLILLLSRLCFDFETSIVTGILNLIDSEFRVDTNCKQLLTSTFELRQEAKNASQQLLNYYVRLQGQQLSAMIKKSVDACDWLSSVEPKSVRAVMKRIVHDLSLIDAEVGQLFEEGSRTDRSSDSSRNRRIGTATGIGNKGYGKSQPWSYGKGNASSIDHNLISNIQKLFSERIEIFSAVEFNKLSVVTGIVKISLKTFLECVRLCTFSRYGLQQIQIDSHFLQTRLWRFVTDDNLIGNMLDEVLISSFQRCLDPENMDNRLIEQICENV